MFAKFMQVLYHLHVESDNLTLGLDKWNDLNYCFRNVNKVKERV